MTHHLWDISVIPKEGKVVGEETIFTGQAAVGDMA